MTCKSSESRSNSFSGGALRDRLVLPATPRRPRPVTLDPASFTDPEVKQALIRNTEEAVSRGVFGAPTFFVGDEMFWGQDRMEFVAEALAA